MSLVAILERDKKGFHYSQQNERQNEDDGKPHYRVHPVRWMKGKLDDERATSNHRSDNEDHEDSGTVAGVERRIVEAAGAATPCKTQIAIEKASLATARATATQRRGNTGMNRFTQTVIAADPHT